MSKIVMPNHEQAIIVEMKLPGITNVDITGNNVD